MSLLHENVDVCLILEGTYPYVAGGVSNWTHETITRQSHLRFHLVSILPPDGDATPIYTLPPNVTGLTTIRLQELPGGKAWSDEKAAALFDDLEPLLASVMGGRATLGDFRAMMDVFAPHRRDLGARALLDSPAAWNLMTRMYEQRFSESSLLDYFWSWRAILSGLYTLLVADLPRAKCYHALSTGFAGLYAARAYLETGRHAMLTEHGIYTNERRIEIASADWLEQQASRAMTVDATTPHLRDLWNNAFASYSRIAYEACGDVITLFRGNQAAQREDGADPVKMRVIANGVDTTRFGAIKPRAHSRPTIALIGRVVPIKDIKTYLRAVAALSARIPDLRAYMIGPADEDPTYAKECRDLVDYLGLQSVVEWTGKVEIDAYLPEIDVLALTSISEAQPLTILEVGAAGIPVVATDVGACRELVLGRSDENPAPGAGGMIVPPAHPQAIAEALFMLLSDPALRGRCGRALKQRVETDYNKDKQHEAYRALYAARM